MDPDKIFEGPNFIWNKYLLRSISVWPYQEPREKFITRVITMFSFWTMATPLSIASDMHSSYITAMGIFAFQVIRFVEELFFTEKVDIQIILENFAGTMWYIGLFRKYCTAIVTEKKFRVLYEEIMLDWEKITDEGSRAVLHKFAKEGRRLTIYYTLYIFMNVIPYVSLPAIVPMFVNRIQGNGTHEKELLHYAEFFVDQQKYFFYLYIHSVICCTIMIGITVAMDTTFAVCTQHLIGLLHIIDYKLKKVSEMIPNVSKETSKSQEKAIHKEIVECVKIHQKAIDFADIVHDAYNYCFFLVAICLVALFSTLTVNLERNVKNPMRLYKIVILWIGNMVYLFYINWPGQKLIDACEYIYTSLFIPAVGISSHPKPKTKSLINMMMMRSREPLTFTAGPLLVMNFECCGDLLRVAFSYFSVVAALSDE